MKSFLPAIVFVFALITGNCYAQKSQPIDDSKTFEVLVVGNSQSPPAVWFSTHPQLSDFASRVKLTIVLPNDRLYRERFASIISGEPPLILFQRASGGVVYAADRTTIPNDADSLYETLRHHYELAQKATKPRHLSDSDDGLQIEQQSTMDCPDGRCPLQEPIVDSPNHFRPLAHVNPFTRKHEPELGNWFTDTTSQIMWVIGGVLVLCCFAVCSVILLGFAIVYARMSSRF